MNESEYLEELWKQQEIEETMVEMMTDEQFEEYVKKKKEAKRKQFEKLGINPELVK